MCNHCLPLFEWSCTGKTDHFCAARGPVAGGPEAGPVHGADGLIRIDAF